ncbi:MAG TPA: transcription termination/antitermination NusG family protein [Pyrinomonadaceae bacterium]|jgi:transcriptional antiterminator RfaH
MVGLKTDDNLRWFVIQAKPKQEDRAASNLRAWRVETFTPRLREYAANKYTGERTCVTKHLFPRYIFARFDVDNSLHKIHFTRGVHSVVSYGNTPAPVDDQIIEVIRARVGEDGYVELQEDLNPGDEVMINHGPLRNFIGVFDRKVCDTNRVMILLTTVSYQAHVVVERELVQSVRHAGQTV